MIVETSNDPLRASVRQAGAGRGHAWCHDRADADRPIETRSLSVVCRALQKNLRGELAQAHPSRSQLLLPRLGPRSTQFGAIPVAASHAANLTLAISLIQRSQMRSI